MEGYWGRGDKKRSREDGQVSKEEYAREEGRKMKHPVSENVVRAW
jgi:hypothetical protein